MAASVLKSHWLMNHITTATTEKPPQSGSPYDLVTVSTPEPNHLGRHLLPQNEGPGPHGSEHPHPTPQ